MLYILVLKNLHQGEGRSTVHSFNKSQIRNVAFKFLYLVMSRIDDDLEEMRDALAVLDAALTRNRSNAYPETADVINAATKLWRSTQALKNHCDCIAAMHRQLAARIRVAVFGPVDM